MMPDGHRFGRRGLDVQGVVSEAYGEAERLGNEATASIETIQAVQEVPCTVLMVCLVWPPARGVMKFCCTTKDEVIRLFPPVT